MPAREKKLTDDARHRFKAAGFVRAPFGTTFGLDYVYRTGVPDNVTSSISGAPGQPASGGTLYIIPRGERRLPTAQQLDLQIVHELTLGRMTVGLIGSVFNVFSSETVTDLGGNIGAYSACTTGAVVDAGSAVQGDCVANPLFGQLAGAPSALKVTSSTFNQALDWQQPRRYEVGVRFEF